MKTDALVVQGLTKRYPEFLLDHISFRVPRGTIVGLIGENGAGKSTTLKAILQLIRKDAGAVMILGKEEADIDFEMRNRIGVVFDGNNFPQSMTPKQLGHLLATVYVAWDDQQYQQMLETFSLPADRKIQKLSKGMQMKLSIAVALSHQAELLILDEATAGLDPIVRDDLLDMLLDFIQDETHAVLLSSHITSDLEKIADSIVFLHEGKVIFEKPKDELRYQYGVLKCGKQQFDALDPADWIAYRKQDYEWQVLVENRVAAERKYPKAIVDPATIDEIMLLYIKGNLR